MTKRKALKYTVHLKNHFEKSQMTWDVIRKSSLIEQYALEMKKLFAA